jgi:hypothetical protein
MQHGAIPVPGTTGSCGATPSWNFQVTEPGSPRFQQPIGEWPCETVPLRYPGCLIAEDGREVASAEGVLCILATS